MKLSKSNDLFNLLDESNRRQESLKKIKVLWFLGVIGFLLCLGSLVIFSSNRNIVILLRPAIYDDRKVLRTCSGIPDIQKFDCFPDSPISEQKCIERGCCYQPVAAKFNNYSVPPLNTPYCYYPFDYNGYKISSMSHDGRHINATLVRNFPSGFPDDVQKLFLVVSLIDDFTVRFKITDSNSARFEVPIPINGGLKTINKPSYSVSIDSKSNLVIARKSTGTTIFKTDLSQLIYSNQFLQLSSHLPSPYLYGIGESYGPILRDVNWKRITLLNSDREPIPNYPLYGSQPFYISLESDGSSNGVFLFNSNAMDVILQPTPAITFRPIGGILDFFIMLGPTPQNVVQQYTSIVGRTFMPPYWSLGFHLCRYGYNSLNKTRETMQRNIDAGIPIDVQWNDIDYMDHYKDFTYDKKNFAGLPEFVDELHAKGMHYVVMTDPGISNSEKPGTYPPYDEGVKDNLFIKNPNGSIFIGKVWNDGNTVFPDFSHPDATAYWKRQFQDFYKTVKFDGVWIDMNEPSNFYDGGLNGCIESTFEDPPYLPGDGQYKLRHKTACMTSRHYNTIHYNEHNLLAYREAFSTSESLKAIRSKRPFIISRATFAGQGVHSGHWSGDIASTWEDMRYTIPSTINFNMYGMSMIGSDICGFNQNTTVELCARWQALGAFYPFSRNHNERVTMEQDPVALGPVVVKATRIALSQRYFMLPYLYTLFYRSHVFGDTVVRPTFFEYPKDKNTYSQDEQFMWGSAMMVIPVLYPNVSQVTAYLPKGIWYHGPLPNMTISSGSKYTFASDITSIVTAIRGGHVVPCQIDSKTTTESRQNPFVLAVALDENKEAQGELYWDDGDSLDSFEKGEYNLIQFSSSKNTISNKIAKNGYKSKMLMTNIQLVGVNPPPKEVYFNGIKCLKRVDVDKLQEKETFHRKFSWFSRYSYNFVPVEETCAFTIIPPVAVAIGFVATDLLTPFNVTWS